MTSKDPLAQSMENTVKHYASLFKLPSQVKVISYQALLCIIGILISVFVISPSARGLNIGFQLGISLFTLTLIVDFVTSRLILGHDPIYDVRRTGVVSLTCWVVWIIFAFAGSITVLLTSEFVWWIRLCLLGCSAALILRLIVFAASSVMVYVRVLAASFVQPLVNAIPFMFVWWEINQSVTWQLLSFFLYVPAIGAISVHVFLHVIDRIGKTLLGIPSLVFFKAFMLNWIANLNGPFEELLEKLGTDHDVNLSLIKFESSKTRAVIAVPSIHPGPFKNIGSSILPALLKNALEKEFGCIACTPHGVFGHELDLASQLQNQRIIKHAIGAMNFGASEAVASPSVIFRTDSATACCQIFGNIALLSITLAPKTTEDFPPELGVFVREEARKHNLEHCVFVNAHNSIDGVDDMVAHMDSLKEAAAKCLAKTAELKREPFEIGAATIFPKEYGIGDGLGDGGITVLVVNIGKQKTAYITIDGNNMITGLREKILLALSSLGIGTGEVYTTDTHSVNAVILGERGYRPVGEAIAHNKLLSYIEEATRKAISNLETVRTGWREVTVPNAKVIGKEKLRTLSLLTDKGLQRAKKSMVPIFALSGLFLTLFLLFV